MYNKRIILIFKRFLKINIHINTIINDQKQYLKYCVIPGDVIGDSIIIDGLYEEDILTQLFSDVFLKNLTQFKESNAIDVGANIGNHSLFFSKYFKKVIAFEPNPIACNILKANILFNNIDNILLFETGLGDEEKVMSFIINRSNVGNSFFINDPKSMYMNDNHYQITKSNIKIGDNLLIDHNTDNVGLIKVDCEGFEYQALKGLKKIIVKNKPIIIFETGMNGVKESNDIINLLIDMGYNNFYSFDWKYKNKIFILLSKYKRVLKKIDRLQDRIYNVVIASSVEF